MGLLVKGPPALLPITHDTGKQLGSLSQLLDRATDPDSAFMGFSLSLFSRERVNNIFQVRLTPGGQSQDGETNGLWSPYPIYFTGKQLLCTYTQGTEQNHEGQPF